MLSPWLAQLQAIGTSSMSLQRDFMRIHRSVQSTEEIGNLGKQTPFWPWLTKSQLRVPNRNPLCSNHPSALYTLFYLYLTCSIPIFPASYFSFLKRVRLYLIIIQCLRSESTNKTVA